MTLFEEYALAAKGLLYVATEKDGQPSLRIMGFAMDPNQHNHWYLVSQPDTGKMADLKVNDRVAVMTVMNETALGLNPIKRRCVPRQKTGRTSRITSQIPSFTGIIPTQRKKCS